MPNPRPWYKCNKCGKVPTTSDMVHIVHKGYYLCKSCNDARYRYNCEVCGKLLVCNLECFYTLDGKAWCHEHAQGWGAAVEKARKLEQTGPN